MSSRHSYLQNQILNIPSLPIDITVTSHSPIPQSAKTTKNTSQLTYLLFRSNFFEIPLSCSVIHVCSWLHYPKAQVAQKGVDCLAKIMQLKGVDDGEGSAEWGTGAG
jgi:hypothetical protein